MHIWRNKLHHICCVREQNAVRIWARPWRGERGNIMYRFKSSSLRVVMLNKIVALLPKILSVGTVLSNDHSSQVFSSTLILYQLFVCPYCSCSTWSCLIFTSSYVVNAFVYGSFYIGSSRSAASIVACWSFADSSTSEISIVMVSIFRDVDHCLEKMIKFTHSFAFFGRITFTWGNNFSILIEHPCWNLGGIWSLTGESGTSLFSWG